MKRSKRHALAAATAPKPPLTRYQLSRRARERRLQRNLLIGVGAAILIALLFIGYGYWREVLRKGDQPIAEVAGQPITTEMYARYVAAQQALIDQQMANLAQLAAASEANRQSYQQQIDLLQQRRQFLEFQALNELIEAQLLRREAEARNMRLTDETINAEIIAEAQRIRQGPFPFLTKPAESPTPTTAPPSISLDEAKAEIRTVLARSGQSLTEDQYRTLLIEPRILRERLQQEIGKDVPTTAEQVHARHILVENEDEAKAIKARLEQGEDFAAIAREHSKDPGSKDKGGDLGWFPRGVMVKPFEDAVFTAAPGPPVLVVQSTFGWHVIQVLEKEANRPLSDEQLRQARAQRFQEWLDGLKKDVVYHQSPDKARWVQQFVERLRSSGQ